MLISILYMFPATSCSSSGESIVSMQQLVCNILCRWPSSIQVGKFLPDLYTRRPLTQNDIYQMLYRYNWFSWWWARGCSKHVENWNKLTRKKNCAPSWSFTIELYRDAGQQNIIKRQYKLMCIIVYNITSETSGWQRANSEYISAILSYT
jgi:hypothetical protein